MKQFNFLRKPVTQLLEAIEAGDIEKCQSLVESMSKRQLNKLKRRNYLVYSECSVTPLICAVMHHQYFIAEILLSKDACADRLGSCCSHDDSLPEKVSSLLCAIDNNDDKMVDILIKFGADVHLIIPGPVISGCFDFRGYRYPINYCFGKKTSIYEKLLEHADMSKEYIEDQHTCFCGIVKDYVITDDAVENLKYVHLALQYGGKICRGHQQEGSCFGRCSFVNYLLVNTVIGFIHERGLDLPTFVGLIDCLYYVCCSDYIYKQSPIYAFPRYLASQITTKDIANLEQFLYTKDVDKQTFYKLAWVLNLADSPSTLKEISRSVIRSNLKSCSPSTCRMLPLPSELINYVSFISDQFGSCLPPVERYQK
ncbi:hypothetical protein ACF0H5_003849 [Mactra antiquata]